jgi:hypothetical protein
VGRRERKRRKSLGVSSELPAQYLLHLGGISHYAACISSAIALQLVAMLNWNGGGVFFRAWLFRLLKS